MAFFSILYFFFLSCIMRHFCDWLPLVFWEADVPDCDHSYTDQLGSCRWLSKEPFFLRIFGMPMWHSSAVLNFFRTASENNRSYSTLVSWQQQNTPELNTVAFVLYTFKSVQLDPKPRSKGPHSTLSLEEGKSLRVCFSDNPSASLCGVAGINLSYQQLHPPDMALHLTATPPSKKSSEGGFLRLCDTLLRLNFLFWWSWIGFNVRICLKTRFIYCDICLCVSFCEDSLRELL